MGLSEFTFRLILIFIPGIISFIIIDNLTTHRQTKIHHWAIYSLLLGMLSYMPWYVLINIVKSVYNVDMPIQFITSIVDSKAGVNFNEIIIASVCALFLGFFLTKVINSGCIFTFAQNLGVSNKFGELDAWDRFIKKFSPEWIRIRDLERNLVFQGVLQDTSDANDRDGIILTDVSVFSDDVGKFLYSTAAIYIPQKMESLLIELPIKSDMEPDTKKLFNVSDIIKIHDMEHKIIILGKIEEISIDNGCVLTDVRFYDESNINFYTAAKFYIPQKLNTLYVERIEGRDNK